MKEVSLFCHFSFASTGLLLAVQKNNYKTVHLHCVESYENLSQGFVGEGWVAADNEKKPHFFLNNE